MKPVAFDQLPQNLPTDERLFVGWCEEHDGRRFAKVPYCVTTGRRASVTDPSTWCTLAAVRRAYEKHAVGGLGLVLIGSIVGGDLDDCYDDTGTLSPLAVHLVQTFWSYTERSPSERGLRILMFGRLPVSGRQRRDVALYNTKRFVTLTGDRLPDCPDTIADRQAVIDAWYPQLFPSAPRPALEPAAGPVLDDDLALIQRAQRARNGATFRKLWAGDDSDYPSRSEADMALAAILGFWAQRNETRVDALFRMSGLMRPKWDEPRGDTTYGALTVRHAVRTVLAVYDPEYSRKEGDVTAAVREALRKTLR